MKFFFINAAIGLVGSALDWLHSYLSDRQQLVFVRDVGSSIKPVRHGVPQRSVFGPILFSIYLHDLGVVIRAHGINCQFYADDTALFISGSPSSLDSTK